MIARLFTMEFYCISFCRIHITRNLIMTITRSIVTTPPTRTVHILFRAGKINAARIASNDALLAHWAQKNIGGRVVVEAFGSSKFEVPLFGD